MSYNLFLDRERDPKDVTWIQFPVSGPWIVVRNILDFKLRITSFGLPDFVTFSHNLSPEHNAIDWTKFTIPDYLKLEAKTGYDCAGWLIDYCVMYDLNFPPYTVHSQNSVGGEHIHSAIWAYKRWKETTKPHHIK